MRRLAPVAAVFVTGGVLAACTDDSGRQPAPTATVPATASSSPSSSPSSSAAPSTTSSSPSRRSPIRVGRPQVLASGLAVPWGVAFLPDGSALVSERDSHRIVRVTSRGDVREVGAVPGVADDTAEGGLLGMAVSPSFAQDASIFAYLTSDRDNRVVKMTYRGDRLSSPSAIITGIPKAAVHNGGRIAFGPDRLLYVTTGDATEAERAPDRDYLGGKVLRMTADGEPAPGNPFPDSVVYSVGHRNPQGLAWGPDGRLYEAEFGQNALDEINLVRPGADYGWPSVEGTIGASRPGLTKPLLTWSTDEASPSGMAFAGDSLWLATLQGERLYRIALHGPGRVGEPTVRLEGAFGRLRTVILAPDGSLWVTTSNRDGRGSPGDRDDRIIRLPLTG